MLIDQKAFDFIVAQEVTSPAYFERHYRQPEWPGAASGITIGCGYDLGYASPAKITADWGPHVNGIMLRAMIKCSGVKGLEARALLPEAKTMIDIPWNAALDVFQNRDIPQWTGAVQRALPNTDKLSPLCLGMHVATAYNRGAGGYTSDSPRFSEMHNIRNDMQNMALNDITAQFLSMVRLWPTLRGLQTRYTQTAALWKEGLSQPVPTSHVPPIIHDGEDPLHAGPARTKPPATTATQHGTAGGIVVAGGAAAHAAHNAGAPLHIVMAIIAFAAVAGITVWLAWYKNRNPK